MPDRQTLRREMRSQRRALPDAERYQCENLLTTNIASSRAFQRAERIACYLANDGEPRLDSVIERIWQLGKSCYLPILNKFGHNRLWFAPFTPDTPLINNLYGIAEPDVSPRLWLRPQQLDLVLAPLVAFDAEGNRLGMGGGYYDRSFAFLRHRQHWQRPRLAGIAFAFQQVAQLPAARWDVPLYCVITDDGEIATRGRHPTDQ